MAIRVRAGGSTFRIDCSPLVVSSESRPVAAAGAGGCARRVDPALLLMNAMKNMIQGVFCDRGSDPGDRRKIGRLVSFARADPGNEVS